MEDIYHCRNWAEITNSPLFVWFFNKITKHNYASGSLCNFLKLTNQKRGFVTILSLAQE